MSKSLTAFEVVLAAALVASSAVFVGAADHPTNSKSNKQDAQSVDLFAGIDSGDLKVKFIPKNDREAQVLIENTTKQPLNIQLPDAFVGVPVLAQIGGAGAAPRQRNRNNNNSNNNQNQAVGGGFGGGGGGGVGGFGGGGGFNVPPETVGKLKVVTVCLEHGKEDPHAQIPYEIRNVDSYSKDANLHAVLSMLGEGNIDQRAAQAAAWHYANGLNWEELAAKRIHHLGGRPDEQYFTAAEIQMALRIAGQAEVLAKTLPVKETKPAKQYNPADPYSTSSSSPADAGKESAASTVSTSSSKSE